MNAQPESAASLSVAPPAWPRRLALALLLAGSVAMLWWHARQLQFFCDDSYISYRFSQNFADGHGLVYNVGERVEGYTNFLWVVMLGGALRLGFAAEAASLALGVAFLVAALALTAVEGRRLLGSWPFALAAVALLVCQGPMILWSISGLESSCFVAMSLAALVVFERALERRNWTGMLGAGALYALSSMVRPDGVVFGAAAGLALVLRELFARPVDRRGLVLRAASLLLGFVAVFGPFVLWRHSYYGDWLPNTFYVKAGGLVNAELGVAYFAAWLQDYPLSAALAALGLVATATLKRWRPVRGAFFHVALAIVLFTSYVGWAGGDYMALYRFVMPVLPLAALLGAAALLEAYRRVESLVPPRLAGGFGRVALAAGALVLLAGGGFLLWLPSQRSVDGVESAKRLQTVKGMRRNSLQWVQAGKSVHDALPADVTIATTAAGALPYFAGQRCIDQSGLCDRYTAKVDSDPWFLDRVGHMKQATRKHLAELKPAAIFWHPIIETVERFLPVSSPPTPDYEIRALRVRGIDDEPRFLWFWARRDALAGWKGRGVLTRDEAANLAREERAVAAKAAAQSGNGKGAAGGAPHDVKAGPPSPELRVTKDFLIPKPQNGPFVTRRLHELDPTADEVRISVEDVSRPLWGENGSCDVTLSGAPGSGIEFELASAGDEKTLPGLAAPEHVEVRFETEGTSTPLQVYALPATTPGARAWKRFRADASKVKGAGQLVLMVGGKPVGPASGFLASIPRVLDVVDAAPRKNILFVTIDTLRADYLSCYGHDRPTSPHIDAVAKEGVVFERCVSQAPWTLPSYSSIFTGLVCESHGVVRRTHKLGFSNVTFVEELALAGYATGAIVSGTFTDAYWGFDQGFDDYDDLGMVVDETDLTGTHAKHGLDPAAPGPMKEAAHQRITSPEVVEKAMHWLDAHRDRRFCLVAHFFDPHEDFLEHPGISEKFPPRKVAADFPNPRQAGDDATDKLRALYEGEIAFTDQWIGKLLDHVRELGLWDDTIVVVCADHGDQFFEHGDEPEKCLGHGHSLFNEEVHVPLILRVPGVAAARVVSPVANLEIGPTLLELARAEPGGEWAPQGRSLTPLFADPNEMREEPVLSAMFKPSPVDKTQTPREDEHIQVAHRLDRGDFAAIAYFPKANSAGATFLFDWTKNPWQDLRKNLAGTMKVELQAILDHYRNLRPELIKRRSSQLDEVDLDEKTSETLKRLGYTGNSAGAPPPSPPGDPDPTKAPDGSDPDKDHKK
jgi:arylsulfatase A-like enzyme